MLFVYTRLRETNLTFILFFLLVKEARLKEIKSEILNSEKLKVSLSAVSNFRNRFLLCLPGK